jgi:hypothetical protein
VLALDLYRFNDNGKSTLGLLFVNGRFRCYTLEDEARSEKVKGETRIPAGTYPLGYRNVESPLTKRYRSKHDFFDFHLHIQDVPGFDFVYIHIGNTDKNSDGCVLVGDSVDNNAIKDGFLGSSTPAFKRLYKEIYPKILNDGPAVIRIHDEKTFAGFES